MLAAISIEERNICRKSWRSIYLLVAGVAVAAGEEMASAVAAVLKMKARRKRLRENNAESWLNNAKLMPAAKYGEKSVAKRRQYRRKPVASAFGGG